MRFLSDWRRCATITVALICALGTVAVGPAAAQSLDHFLCYETHGNGGSTGFTPLSVGLIDLNRSSTVNVRRPSILCAPANKNGEDPTAPSHPVHLEGYSIRATTPFATLANQQVVDQFGTLFVDLKKPTGLMVPTAKSHVSPPPAPIAPAVDHFQCYVVKATKGTTKFARHTVTTVDQFGPLTVELRKPKHLCIPVDKNNESPGASQHPGNLMCYQARSMPRFAGVSPLFTTNQFGTETLAARKPTELCVPALRPGTVPTPTVTPTATVSPTPTITATPTLTRTPTATPTAVFPCGNGVIDGAEECDGNAPSACPGTCTVQCKCPVCGDNSVNQANEECDGLDAPTCPGSCQPNCACPGVCDPIDPSLCLHPFPNDYFTIVDPTTDTGRRVHMAVTSMPKNQAMVPIDPTDHNLNDGFSPGNSIELHVPNVDLVMTNAAPITNIERSLDADSPTVIVNTDTLAHHLHWAELDSNATSEPTRALIMRPSINFDDGTRYIVALRNMKDPSGALIAPNADFLAYRDGTPTGDPAKEARRPHMEDIFTTLAAAGVPRADLYLAWDFTVASTRSLTERMLFLRNDGFSRLGAASPTFAVTQVDEEVDSNIFRRVQGTFTVERYVSTNAPGARFILGPDGLPLHQPTPQDAMFVCNIPRAALASATATAVPARPSLYGHGLLGSRTEVNAGNVEAMGNEHNFVFCATDWIGMASADIGNAAATLGELSNFPTITDRLQQSFLNQLYLARLIIHPQGFTSNAAFKDMSGTPVIDTSEVYYDGNSQGGIYGGSVMAIAQDITRGVLGVTGMNYSTLLTRSSDFALYSSILYPAYPNELERPLIFSLIQMLWDRSDPNGYSSHITGTRLPLLPNTPAHKVLMHEAFGDFQVANIATEVQARTIGASIYQPALAPGRHADLNPYFGIPAIPSFPFDGSALVVWDAGTPTPPTINKAPTAGSDPHSKPRSTATARTQKSEFLKPAGAVVDECSGAPCLAP